MTAPSSSTRRSLVVGTMLVALASIVLLIPVLELWDADLSVPLESVYAPSNGYVYAGDAPFYQMLAKGGIDHAWFLTNSSLGWPIGQQVYDLPQTLDNLNLVMFKALDVVFGDVGTTINVFFVLTFAMVASAAFLVLRRLRVSAPTSFVVALLYTFLPYHFARGVPHVFLSAYWVVPIAVYLMLRVVSDDPPFTKAGDGRFGFRVKLFDRSGVLWLLACAAIASTGSYYALFAVTLIAVVALVDIAANRRWRVAASGALAVAAIGVVVLVNVAPTLVYWQVEGQNDALFRRLPYETEAEGLKVSQLLLPIPHHRVGTLAESQADSTRFTPVPSEGGQQLGVIGALGFLGVLGALLLAGRRRARRDAPPTSPSAATRRASSDLASSDTASDAASSDTASSDTASSDTASSDTDNAPSAEEHDEEEEAEAGEAGEAEEGVDGLVPGVVMRTLGVMTVASILLATVSGFSLLVAGAGFRDLRSYNRIVVFIAFAALVAVGFGLDWIGRRLPNRAWRVPLATAGLALVLVVGILDQVSPAAIPDYATTQARWDSDEAFVSRIERVLHSGAPLADPDSATPAVFQLPYRYFPEAQHAGSLGPYDLVRGYLHSDDLAWSWGGVRGRGADWQLNVVAHPVDDFLDRITAVGFSGLVLDRSTGYDDGAPSEMQLSAALGEPIVSRDGELAFWDLRPHAEELRRRLGGRGVAELREETLADVPVVRAQGS